MPAQKLPVEFGEWRPDVALLDTKFASEVENVFAGVNSYLPFPSLSAFSNASLLNGGNDTNTKVLLQFEGADASTVITDSNTGGSAHVWTVVGTAQIDTAQSAVGSGSSLLLDGAGACVTTTDHADYDLGSGPFTIDFWFQCTAAGGTLQYLAGQGDAAGTAISFAITRSSNNWITASIVNSSGVLFGNLNGTTQFTNLLNTGWHHLALVRNGSSLILFIDGVVEARDNAVVGTVLNSAFKLSVGARGELTTSTWKGWIDEFRISNSARWTTTFAPPSGPSFISGGTPCGLYSARTLSGEWKIYAGTQTKLFTWSRDKWTDISRTVGGAYHVADGDLWMWEQSGQHLVAVNINDNPQVIDIDAGTSFADLAGSPPRATNVKQIGDFLFLSGLLSGGGFTNRTIIWSAINDITGWIVGTNLCDMQEMPDGGPVQGVAGGEIGYVLQDRAVRTLQFLPGDTSLIFSFSRVLDDRGCVSKYGFDTIGNVLYFVSEDGFYSMTGQQVTPIGQDKVNEWFLANSDVTRRNVVHCIAGVNKPRVAWVYHSFDGSPMYDRQILFDWSNSRWARATVSAWVWGLLSSTGLDLDTTGSEPGDALLDSTAPSLDSFSYVGGRPQIGAINPGGFLSALTGPNLPATMETAEVHLSPGMRSFVSDAYPLDDVRDDAAGTVAAGTRERLQDVLVWESPVMIEITGSAALYSSSRLHRFRRYIPAASVWTHAQGVVIEAQQDGTVA